MFHIKVDEEVSLQMLTALDADRLYKITDESRTSLKQWLPWVEMIQSEKDSLLFIKQALQAYLDFRQITAGIFMKDVLVGVIGFNRIDSTNKIASIGYWLTKESEGKGIMTRAVSAFVTYGFAELLLNKIEIRVAIDNKKSRAIPERLHFKQEGIIRDAEKLPQQYVDHALYGILKREWNNP